MIKRRLAAALGSVVVAAALIPSMLSARDLTFEDRVAAQRAIEQVNWNHRIWPKENPQPKPPLSAVMSDDAIRATVEDYIEKSNALERLWHRPITAEQLQAEMNRMAANSHDPQLLQEIFAALADDPYVIAETLARQTLADRLIHSWYANDPRFHGDTRARASAALDACASVDCMHSLGGEYRKTTLSLQDDSDGGAARLGDDVVHLDPVEWKQQLDALAKLIPSGRLSPLEETADAFIVRAVLTQQSDAVTIASVSWPKRSFDIWWSGQRRAGASLIGVTASFVPAAITAASCNGDTWTATASTGGVPSARSDHTAVWTGVEMVIWGGLTVTQFVNTGGRYNPSTDAWNATSVFPNVPDRRYGHSAVWTGTEMIVWGGHGPGGVLLSSGGRYNPNTDTWTATSDVPTSNLPAARVYHTAVWTGTEMIVWGGNGGASYLNTGSRYTPSTNTWTATSNGPTARGHHTAVWAGTEMIVWGGYGNLGVPYNTGLRYFLSANNWTITPTFGHSIYDHSAVWTGSEMIVWGGDACEDPNCSIGDGLRYNPTTNSFVGVPAGGIPPPPSGRAGHSAVWTGTEMIVWGGHSRAGAVFGDGGRYNPLANNWTPISAVNAPSARYGHTATSTGSEMITWGGTPRTVPGGRYCACQPPRTVYFDADHDGYGRTTSAVSSNCDGSAPAGYVDNAGDCDDGNSTVYPGAAEVNDGIDNQCAGSAGFGVIDEVSGVSGFMTAGNTTLFSWPPQTGASSYDVVRSTTPDFSTGCVAFTSKDPFLSDPESPAVGSSFYYLVRASTPHVGSWGQRHDGTPRGGGCLPP